MQTREGSFTHTVKVTLFVLFCTVSVTLNTSKVPPTKMLTLNVRVNKP